MQANRIDWDWKLHCVLRAYCSSYKTSIRSTPFRVAVGVEAVMPTEFFVLSLRIQVEHKLNENELKQVRAEALLRLEEERLNTLRM